jgi:hypothetical protein
MYRFSYDFCLSFSVLCCTTRHVRSQTSVSGEVFLMGSILERQKHLDCRRSEMKRKVSQTFGQTCQPESFTKAVDKTWLTDDGRGLDSKPKMGIRHFSRLPSPTPTECTPIKAHGKRVTKPHGNRPVTLSHPAQTKRESIRAVRAGDRSAVLVRFPPESSTRTIVRLSLQL